MHRNATNDQFELEMLCDCPLVFSLTYGGSTRVAWLQHVLELGR